MFLSIKDICTILSGETIDVKLTEGRGIWFVTERSAMFQEEEVCHILAIIIVIIIIIIIISIIIIIASC